MIEQICQKRNITELVHFTDVRHLPSIVRFGLLPRNRLGEVQTETYPNDEHRLDGHPESVSLSISFPNCMMFYKYRHKNQTPYAVVCLQPAVLWQLNSAFYSDNAASAAMSRLAPNSLMTPAAFNALFDEMEGERSRQEQRLLSNHPTNVQAEVLTFAQIPPQYITRIVFNNTKIEQQYRPLLQGKPTAVHGYSSDFFGSRSYMLEY
ncbi:DarT ssDNA thymidine ADP-ribosyltransferase family protein [Ferrimonas sp. SCSIO 43195]|uniref:DarT ssDNA thymidine ADP-ribosyltransferase family protein n=1 Tax=Ferrimonas sp. SCSIO 43195 TaxID=2822844 RepID=UPI0020757136|nr:DarT ssDNA thymidine ADP-ribosyltransferase family protein [Ferrimonas sp. SCSIO 43195]USD38556.1 DUF4433 domain-containing protein [Ferrimonas sp. SCSIO 43195]